ncbi:hypothetical protein [Stutzerimonas nitrititolerans]|uniref:hypothetical protein n=1 Tax=Stutzerimonas nitrititolerans TaxID=2482751 RepID=UPI0028A2CFB8|nr:hypothetical protein [Stutzerimonas nitrititolerans]
MGKLIDVIETYEDLLKRPNFHASLSFHPRGDRRFGTVVAPYRFLDKIPCGIEACHTPHLSGYLITTGDDLETAIGGHCGKKYFGVSFTRERKRIDDAVARQRRIATVTAMLDNMAVYLKAVESLERDYKELREKKERLMGAIGPSLFLELKNRADRGQTDITEEVPMTQVEATSYFATSNRKANDGKGWPTKSLLLARLEGMDFIRSRFKDMLVVNLITPMRDLSKLTVLDIDNMKPRALASTAKWVGEVPVGLQKAQGVVEAGHRFFQSENIAKLVHLGASQSALAAMIGDLRAEESQSIR